MQALGDVEIIWYDNKIYVLKSLRRRVLDWYHLFINHTGGSRLAKTIREICYWKGLITKAGFFTKKWKNWQKFKRRKTLYGHLPPKNIAELKPWDLVHLYLIGPYSKSIIQQHPGGAIILKNYILACMTIIDPATSWFKINKIPTFYLNEVTAGND